MLLEQEGAALFNVDLSIGECGGRVAVGLRGELGVADAVSVDLAGLEFIDSSGVAALRLTEAFHVHPSVDEAAVTAVLPAGSPDIHQPPSAMAALTHNEPL